VHEGIDTTGPRTGRKAARYVVPFAVVGVAAATIGLVPALADSGDPNLPKVTAQQLIEKIATSDVQQLSGTVKINTDLGLPDLGGAAGLALGGAGSAQGGGKDASGSSADPQSKLLELATGTHTLRVAEDGPTRQKLSILENASEYSVIHNGDQLWAYDSASDQAYHAKTEKGVQSGKSGRSFKPGTPSTGGDVPATPDELARQALKSVEDTTSVTVDGTEQVAGRDAYRLVIKPKQADSTVGSISLAVDAKTGTPLKFTLTPANGGSAIVDVGYAKVDFAKPAASTFTFTPPKGTKVTEADKAKQDRAGMSGKQAPGGSAGLTGPGDLKGLKVIGRSWDSIAEFTLPGGKGLPSASSGASGQIPQGAQGFLDSLGEKAHGKFGSGTVFSTRLVNVLITDDGKVYAGAVTKDALVKAANAAG
jgi:outer membrane lipoprotein-sorting protein